MKKSGLIYLAVVVLFALAGIVYVVVRPSASPSLSSIRTDIPGTRGVLSGGILLPQGVPLALKDPKDLDLWIRASPATINGRPMSAGNTSLFSEMQSTGRIVSLSSGTRVEVFQNDGKTAYVKTSLGTQGWVPSFAVH